MAALQHRNGSFRVIFRYHGKQHTFTLGPVSEDEALAKTAQVDYLLLRLKQRLASVPAGTSIVDYLQFDGKPQTVPTLDEKCTLAQLRDKYVAANTESLEATTLKGIAIHFRHLTKSLGEAFPIAELSRTDLQAYVDQRAKAKGRYGRKVSTATIKKELITLRTAWNWGVPLKLVSGRFPWAGLKYPKVLEKPPFMTRQEIERRIATRHLTKPEVADLWEALYLRIDETSEMLQFVKEHAIHPFIYPMVCFAAHTGARRSEIVRARVDDVDFETRVVTITEKKRVRGKITTRRVPLSMFLFQVLKDWLAIHPGAEYLFSHSAEVGRSRKRSHTTGHKGSKTRPTTAVERAASVTTRSLQEPDGLTVDEVRDHLQRTLAGSKWEVVRGWHVARHSFISACASRGVDQRLIESWAGHMSKEMSRRYAHLYPSVQQEALASVFGSE